MKKLITFLVLCFLLSGCEPPENDGNNTNSSNNTTTNNINNSNNTNNHLNNDAGTDTGTDTGADSGTDTGTDSGVEPSVEIISPSDGATVTNPVTFTISAENVSTVRIFADDWPLSEAWDPAQTTSLTYTFNGTGYARSIVCRGYDSQMQEVASDSITITVEDDSPGTLLGNMYNTYYYLAREADYPPGSNATLYDVNCNPIAYVNSEFSDDVCIEGSGILDDGTVINYASTCSCGRTCPTGGIICYQTLNPAQYPWGMGSSSNPLQPLRSWAVDSDLISSGTILYAPEWDGVNIPLIDGIGGFVHDGCFRADDVGGWINGMHYDFFAGTHDMWQFLETVMGTNHYSPVYTQTPACQYLGN